MKTVFYSVETKTEGWVDEGKLVYRKKLAAFFPFEIESIKSPPIDRDDAGMKRRLEGERILRVLKPNDLFIAFDEAGKVFSHSEEFAAALGKQLEKSPPRLVFLIGGAFGIDEPVREKAQAVWSLGPLTFNHWVAQLAALEQIYRAMTILKRIPYHNR